MLNVEQELKAGTPPGVILKKIECYATNTGEMASELRTALVDPTTEDFKKIDIKVAAAAIQASYDQFRETILECTGEEVIITLPSGTAGVILGILLQSLGIDLNSPIIVDSPIVK
jgi:hypothetical protein